MKKKIIIPFFIATFILLILFYREHNAVIVGILEVFAYVFIPALFPFMLLVNIFIGTNFLFDKKINIKFRRFILFFILIIGGTPILTFLTEKLTLNHKQKQRLVNSFSTSSFPFIIFLFSNTLGFIFPLLIFLILSALNLTNYFIFNKDSLNLDNIEIADKTFLQIITTALNKSCSGLFLMLQTILLFSLPAVLLNEFLIFPYNLISQSLIEYSNATYQLISSTYEYKIPIALFFISFQSLTAYLQIKIEEPHLKIVPLVMTRLIIAIILVIIFLIFF